MMTNIPPTPLDSPPGVKTFDNTNGSNNSYQDASGVEVIPHQPMMMATFC
jgi:hypothetical protein